MRILMRFSILPDKNGTYKKDTYSETTKRHYTLDGLLSENDTIIRYKNEIPAKNGIFLNVSS